MSAIRFLTALAKSVHSKLFSDDSTLKQVQPALHFLASSLVWRTHQLLPPKLLVLHSGCSSDFQEHLTGTFGLLLGMSIMILHPGLLQVCQHQSS